MQFIYIGFWDSMLNWMLNAILKPVITFLGSLLSKVFSWLFNSILGPILKSLAVPVFEILLDLLKTVFSGILYSIMAELLKLVDYMEKAFRIIIGLDAVEVKLAGATAWAKAFGAFNGTTVGNGDYVSMPITEAFFSFDAINKAYWMLNLIGLTLALLFATIAVARSSFDLDFEGKRPVSRVLSSLFRSVANLFTVQLVLMFLVKLASAILSGIDLAMTSAKGGGATSLGRMVFAMTSLDACKSADYNISKSQAVGVTDKIRRGYYYTKCPNGENFPIYDFTKTSDVELNFDLSKLDFLIGYLLAVFLLVIMGACLIVFVQRLMDMLVLYLASPFFVAMIPLDDGERFGKWRELFIGKCFSGFGMVVAMQLYVMLCPAIMDSTMRMSKNSVEFDYLCKMLFLVGGAWAILKSGNMITGLLSESAGNAEARTASVAAGVGMNLAGKAGKIGLDMGMSGVKMLTGLAKPSDASNKGGFGDEEEGGGSENKFAGSDSSSKSGGAIPGISGHSASTSSTGRKSALGSFQASGTSGSSGLSGSFGSSGRSGGSGTSGTSVLSGLAGASENLKKSGISENAAGSENPDFSKQQSGVMQSFMNFFRSKTKSGENKEDSETGIEMTDLSGREDGSEENKAEPEKNDSIFEERDSSGEPEIGSINDYDDDDDDDDGGAEEDDRQSENDGNEDQTEERAEEPERFNEPDSFNRSESFDEPESSGESEVPEEEEAFEESGDSEKAVSGEEQKPFFEPVTRQKKKLSSSLLGGLVQTYTYRDSKNRITGTSRKFNLGRLFSVETGPKGREIKLFGMGMRFSNGEITKVNFGVGSISRMRGTDGKMHTSRVKVLGCKVRADMKTGEKKLTDVGPIGLHMKVGKDGHRKLMDLGVIGLHMDMGKDGHRQLKDLGSLGIHRKKDEDGIYHTKSVLGGMYKNYDASDDGEKK